MNSHWVVGLIIAIVLLTLAEVSALVALALVVKTDQLAILLGSLSALVVPTVAALLALLRAQVNAVEIKRNTETLTRVQEKGDKP